MKYLKEIILNEKFSQFLENDTIQKLKNLKNEEEILNFRLKHFGSVVSLIDEKKKC